MRAESTSPLAATAHGGGTAGPAPVSSPQKPAELAAEVARVLAGMSYEERVRAYRSGALSAQELALAAGRYPEEMPLLNGELEWIAITLE